MPCSGGTRGALWGGSDVEKEAPMDLLAVLDSDAGLIAASAVGLMITAVAIVFDARSQAATLARQPVGPQRPF